MTRAALTLARAALAQIIPTTPDYREQHVQALAAIDAALADPAEARVNQCGETCERASLCAVCAGGLAAAARVPLTKEAMADIIADGLRDTYHCLRVWSAWSYGTMGPGDFSPVDQSDTPAELAESIIAALTAGQKGGAA